MSKGSPALTARATSELFDIVDQARQDAARGAAIRALILLGADRVGYDLSAAGRELALLLIEPLDEPLLAALRYGACTEAAWRDMRVGAGAFRRWSRIPTQGQHVIRRSYDSTPCSRGLRSAWYPRHHQQHPNTPII